MPKEPWEMTKGDFSRKALRDAFPNGSVEGKPFEQLTDKQAIATADAYFLKPTGVHDHEYFVRQALSEGKPVPPKVLADYPDLTKPNRETSEPQPESFRIIPHYSPVTGILTSFTVEDPEGNLVTKWREYVTEINKRYPAVPIKEIEESKVEYSQYRVVFTLGRASFSLGQLTGKPAVSELGTTQRLARYGVPEEMYQRVIELDKEYNIEELRQFCRERNLPTGGDKKKLISRLLEGGFHGK